MTVSRQRMAHQLHHTGPRLLLQSPLSRLHQVLIKRLTLANSLQKPDASMSCEVLVVAVLTYLDNFGLQKNRPATMP